MTLKFLSIALLVLMHTTLTTVQAQSSFWKPIAEEEIPPNGSRKIHPQQYAVYQLDDAALKAWLEQTPSENNTNVRSSDHILTIPTPDGGTQSFRIVSYPMMEANLAERYPEITNYYGIGVRNPAQHIRLDWTCRGFHAMILGGGEDTYFIDPFQWDDIQHYQVYFKKDYAMPEGNVFECGVTETAVPTEETSTNRMAGDCTFRTYRLAMATTGEYSNYHGATSAAQSNLVLSEVNTAMNRVNGIYEQDIAVRMVLIANTENVFYYDGNTDPYTNNSGLTMLSENQTNINNVIGSSNYDIGHVFSTGGGGIASLRSPCTSGKARGVTGLPNPINDPFYVDYVAHEMGHQFGANHTQNNNCNRVSAAAMEPGSASTIMGYAGICSPNVQNNSDDYFHAISIQEMTANITSGNSSSCDMESSLGNSAPMVTLASTAYNIPNGTPFVLTASSSDADGTGTHTFCWEQFDNEVAAMPPQSTNTGGPAFRTFDPVPSPSRYFPNLADVPNGNTWEVLPTVARTMDFRVTVRDNAAAQGCTDEADVTLTVDGSAGPFNVTSPAAAASWTGNSSYTVSWDVSGTDQAPISCSQVDIFLSTDGGLTYPTLLADDVPNSGSATVNAPNIMTSTARIMVMAADNVFFDLNGGNFSIMSAPLPITLQTLTATPTANTTHLNWRTATELNNDYMAVEYSSDGRRYTEIGRVLGAGTTQEPQDYSFVHEAPAPELNYYRLRQVDYDGQYEYHGPVTARFGNGGGILDVFPTATADELTVGYEGQLDTDATLSIQSTSGRILREWAWDSKSGRRTSFDVTGLPAGWYVLRLRSGREVLAGRFLKQ